jgi:hypothetical protein
MGRQTFLLDISLGILLLLSIIGFHILTKYAFTPIISPEQYKSNLLLDFVNNPILIIGYLIPMAVHILLCGSCVAILFFLRVDVRLLDVFIVSAVPPLVYLACVSSGSLLDIWGNSQKFPEELNYGITYRSSFLKFLFDALAFYLLNIFFLFPGGYITWLLFRNL